MRSKLGGYLVIASFLVVAVGIPDARAQKTTAIFTGLDPAYAALYVAELQGLYKKNGADVAIQTFTSGAEAVTAVRSANAGFVLAGDLPSLKTWPPGDIIGIAPVSWSTTSESIVARADIKKATDLKGKRIGVVPGSAPQIVLANYLAKHGIAPTEVEMVNLTPGDMVPALNRNDIQALIWSPTVTDIAIKAVPGAHYLQKGSEGYGVDRTILSATKATMAENPKLVEAVIRSFLDAVEFIRKDRPKAVELVAQRLKYSADRVAQHMSLWNYDMQYNDTFVKSMREELEFAVKLGILKESYDLRSRFNTEFLKRVSPDLVTVKE